MSGVEVCEDDITPPTLSQSDVEASRKRGIRIYTALFGLQLTVGIACLACSIVAIKFEASEQGVPYYTGSLIIACLMLFSSLLAFRIYNKGPAFSVDDAAKKDVTCALNCHHTCSFLLFFGTVVGLALLWMYGLCLGNEGTTCSYGDNHVTENRIIAAVNFAFGACALASSGVGVCLIRKYGRAFGLESSVLSNGTGRTRLHRTSRMQNVFSFMEQYENNSDFQNCDGFTNFGFEPPYPLPPYTPTAQPQDIHHVASDIPAEPPPPYTETDNTDTRISVDSNTRL